MNIPEALRRAREACGMTKQAVADAIGMQRPSYARYELENSETRAPHIEKLLALADLYGVSIDYLVGRTDNPEISR